MNSSLKNNGFEGLKGIHLGNVLQVVTDRKLAVNDGSGGVDYYVADVVSQSDYFPFGMMMPGRNEDGDDYRYGFNGMEKDDEVKDIKASHYDLGLRHYDPRIGRMMSRDPRAPEYPWQSPYVYHRNSPVWKVDFLGGGDSTKTSNPPAKTGETLENKPTGSEYNGSITGTSLYEIPKTEIVATANEMIKETDANWMMSGRNANEANNPNLSSQVFDNSMLGGTASQSSTFDTKTGPWLDAFDDDLSVTMTHNYDVNTVEFVRETTVGQVLMVGGSSTESESSSLKAYANGVAKFGPAVLKAGVDYENSDSHSNTNDTQKKTDMNDVKIYIYNVQVETTITTVVDGEEQEKTVYTKGVIYSTVKLE